MAGDSDTLFANLPPPSRPQPLAPPFMGTGYGAMPTSRNIEDRRGQPAPYGPFLPDSFSAMMYRLLRRPTAAQTSFVQSHAGGIAPDQHALTMPQDPSYSADPSIMARIKEAQAAYVRSIGASTWGPPNLPTPYPDPSQRGPQFTPDQLMSALQYWGGGQ